MKTMKEAKDLEPGDVVMFRDADYTVASARLSVAVPGTMEVVYRHTNHGQPYFYEVMESLEVKGGDSKPMGMMVLEITLWDATRADRLRAKIAADPRVASVERIDG